MATPMNPGINPQSHGEPPPAPSRARRKIISATPTPIPFPGKRALPGMLLAAGVFGWGAFDFFRYLPHTLRQFSFAAPRVPIPAVRDLTQAGWVALACALSLLSWWLSIRLTRGSKIL